MGRSGTLWEVGGWMSPVKSNMDEFINGMCDSRHSLITIQCLLLHGYTYGVKKKVEHNPTG